MMRITTEALHDTADVSLARHEPHREVQPAGKQEDHRRHEPRKIDGIVAQTDIREKDRWITTDSRHIRERRDQRRRDRDEDDCQESAEEKLTLP